MSFFSSMIWIALSFLFFTVMAVSYTHLLRREANQWADMGIVTAQAAQQYLTRRADEKPLSEAIYRALGADTEQPAPKEQRVCRFALAHGVPADAVELACLLYTSGWSDRQDRTSEAVRCSGHFRCYPA